MATTLSAWQAGSTVIKWVVTIEGCKYILSDAPSAAVLAAGYSADWTSVLGGLFVDLRNNQAIDPDSAFTSHGRCIVRVLDQDNTDTFGTFVNKRLSGAETELATTADRNDTTLTVKSTEGFASSGEVYIGTECIGYSGKTATTFTGCTRGKYSPLACDSTGSGGARFGGHHRVGVDARYIQRNPIVSQLPRRWIGKRVAVRLHTWDAAAATLNSATDAQLVFTGRIVGIADDPETFETVLELEHLGAEWKNAVIGRDILQGNVAPGIQLVTGRTFNADDWKSGSANSAANELVVVASGASGANQVDAGYYTGEEIVSILNRWLGSEKAAGRLWGFYSLTYAASTQTGLRTTVHWCIENASRVSCDWFIRMPGEIAAFLGFAEYDGDPRGQTAKIYVAGKTGNDVNTKVGDAAPYRSLFFRPFGPGHAQEFTDAISYELEDERGTFVDQYAMLPSLIKEAADADHEWGLFLLDDKMLIVGSYDTNVISNCWIAPYQLTADNSTAPVALVGRRVDESGPLTIRQVYLFETTFGTFLNALVYSTGTAGYNHSDYDVLPANFGFAMPGEVLGPEFERTVWNLPGAYAPLAIMIDEPTKLSQLIEDDLKLRRTFVRWKDEHFQLCQWKTPQVALSTYTLAEANKAAPAGAVENHRAACEETDDYHKPSAKIDYCRDFASARNAQYLRSIQIEDQASTDGSGGSATGTRSTTLKMRNTYSQFQATGAAIEQLVPEYMATMPMFSESAHRLVRSIDLRAFEGVAPGDIVTVSDSFARDPITGARSIAARAAYIVRHSYDPGGPNAQGRVRDMQGEVELMFLDCQRGGVFSPAADVDDTASAGGFSAGYNSGVPSLRCYTHHYSHEITIPTKRGNIVISEPADAANFEIGDDIVIVERDPANPAAPVTWTRGVVGVSGNDITLSSTLSAPAWDATKRYRIISTNFDQAAGTQQDDCYQADDADLLIEDIDPPYHFSATEESWDYNSNGGTEKGEWIAALSYGDGKPWDPGHDNALARTLNALIDYKTAHQGPCLWSDDDDVSSPLGSDIDVSSIVLYMGPVFFGTEHLNSSITRTLTVAPFFSSVTGSTAQIRITLSRMPPMDGPSTKPPYGASDYYGAPSFGDYFSQTTTWSTSSTTWQTGADKTVSIAVKDLFFGYAWLTIEGGGDVRCRGLAKCIEGPRVVAE